MTVDITKIRNYIGSLSSNDRIEMRQQLGIKPNAITFLFVGRLIPLKGLSDLIAAFDKIQRENVTLLIVGDGNMRSQIEKMTRQNKKIIYAGRLTDEQLFKAYFVSDVVVLPSHFEPWGLVVNEAMAAGKPVIVSDRVGCIDDLILENETGLIVKAQCISSLCNALKHMHDNENHKLMGKRASEIINSWTLENEALRICQAWQGLKLA